MPKNNLEYMRKYKRQYYKKKPWARTVVTISTRCCRNGIYFKRGIKNFLTIKDLEYLWFRDKAYLLKQPSIDRIDNDGDYTIANCHYMEYLDNISKGNRKEWSKDKFMFCSMPKCNEVYEAKGHCMRHYRREQYRRLHRVTKFKKFD